MLLFDFNIIANKYLTGIKQISLITTSRRTISCMIHTWSNMCRISSSRVHSWNNKIHFFNFFQFVIVVDVFLFNWMNDFFVGWWRMVSFSGYAKWFFRLFAWRWSFTFLAWLGSGHQFFLLNALKVPLNFLLVIHLLKP